MTDDTKFIIEALRMFNSWQPAWTRVKTFAQLTPGERLKVLGIAESLKIQEKDFVGV